MPERVLSPRQIGERLSFGKTKTHELLRSGVLPLIRLNSRTVRIREADFDEWVRAGMPLLARKRAGAATGERETAGAGR